MSEAEKMWASNEFFTPFWSWWIIGFTVAGIIGCFILIRWLTTEKLIPGKKYETVGHVWDGDLSELNTPLPSWWLNMFYITLVFGIIYLILYPGLGSFKGVLGWTDTKQYEREMAKADAEYGPLFAEYAGQDIVALGKDPDAVAIGRRLYLNYCSVCHGSDAGGGPGFPNLADKDWLYGGTPEAIKTSIMEGRNGAMPPMAAAIGGDEGVEQVTAYVLSLSGREADPALIDAGKAKFAVCAGCHGPDGKGNQMLGAPNLTDNVWLYGGSPGAIKQAITQGRNGKMPAHKKFLGNDKSHVITAYIYSLSAED
jgi:cytochrome c oxidase cbb3-type subunit 3